MKLKPWYVIAWWSTPDSDEGDYATFVWASDRTHAESICIAEMNASMQKDDEFHEYQEYDIRESDTLVEWIRVRRLEIKNAKKFIAAGLTKSKRKVMWQPVQEVFPEGLASFEVFRTRKVGMLAFPEIPKEKWIGYAAGEIEEPTYVS